MNSTESGDRHIAPQARQVVGAAIPYRADALRAYARKPEQGSSASSVRRETFAVLWVMAALLAGACVAVARWPVPSRVSGVAFVAPNLHWKAVLPDEWVVLVAVPAPA